MVYALNTNEGRAGLWNDLLHLKQSITLPWIVMGDLNVVLSSDEKMLEDGSVAVVTNELREAIEQTELVDLKYYGQHFTWSNGHTWCKLDRMLVNGTWLATYANSYARFDSFGVLDHSPMLVRLGVGCLGYGAVWVLYIQSMSQIEAPKGCFEAH